MDRVAEFANILTKNGRNFRACHQVAEMLVNQLPDRN
jgi:hypothetical protein